MSEQMSNNTNELKHSYSEISQKEAKSRSLITELSSVGTYNTRNTFLLKYQIFKIIS